MGSLSGKRSTETAGDLKHHAADAVPPGWLVADGSSIPTASYPALFAAIGYVWGGAGASFNIPDFRGEFIRGFDGGRGVDLGRVFGIAQVEALLAHAHDVGIGAHDGVSSGTTAGAAPQSSLGGQTGTYASGALSSGGSETRPRNQTAVICIKY